MRTDTDTPRPRIASSPRLRARPSRWLGPWPVLLLALFAVACSTVPYSNRQRIILLSEGQEAQMGLEAYEKIVHESPVLADGHWDEIVNRVGHRIAAIADQRLQEAERHPFEWEFKVIDDPKTVNAFCLPGGKVAFYRGILPICKDELGVAVVMGHEVAHALARHGGDRVSQQVVLNLGISVLAAISSDNPETQETVAQALGVGVGVAFVLPFSRDHESEADYIGLMMMAEAGYDPREAPRFWERMKALKNGEETSEFLSTHPSDANRIQALHNNMSEALDYYEKAIGRHVPRTHEVITSE